MGSLTIHIPLILKCDRLNYKFFITSILFESELPVIGSPGTFSCDFDLKKLNFTFLEDTINLPDILKWHLGGIQVFTEWSWQQVKMGDDICVCFTHTHSHSSVFYAARKEG